MGPELGWGQSWDGGRAKDWAAAEVRLGIGFGMGFGLDLVWLDLVWLGLVWLDLVWLGLQLGYDKS